MNHDSRAEIDFARRTILFCAGVATWIAVKPATGWAQTPGLAAAIRAYTGGTKVTEGRVRFDIAELIDNGNTVPITIHVESPMTATNHVVAIAVFNEKNPEHDVARFQIGPRAGRAQVSTRMRLATSQKLVAIANMNDGSHWSQSVDVIVTLAACIEL